MDGAKYLLIGGGVASVCAIQGIREHDPEGSILLLCGEDSLPYDRPPLSKGFLVNPEMSFDDISSKFDSFYPDNRVDVRKACRASRLDLGKRIVHCESGEAFQYEKLLLATGSRAKPLTVPGYRNARIFGLRTIEDAMGIREAAKPGAKAIVVGAGFIGMEAAAKLSQAGIDVTVLCLEDHPWSVIASSRVGRFMQTEYEKHGVRFLTHETAAAFHDGPEVVTQSNMRLPCDFVVVGAGVELNVEYAIESGIFGDHVHGITTDERMLTSDPHVYAAGDIANFYDKTADRRWHCEHHLNAKWQGQCAGANMAGAEQAYDRVAYLWSDVFDLHMILRGEARPWSNATLLGDLEAGEFVELHADPAGTIKTGLAMSKDEPKLDPIADKLDALIRAKAKIDDLSYDDIGL